MGRTSSGRWAWLAVLVSGLVVAVATPATAAPEPSAVRTGEVVEDRVERAARTGTLRVSVTGIRAGSAAVVVTGPRGYSRRLNRTTTLRALTPGRYKVAARTVRLAAGTAAPARTTQQVRVVRNRTRSVTVRYLAPLPYTGVLTFAITTPTGVPGTVSATGPGPTLAVTKAPTGTSTTRSYRVKPGTWKVTPAQVAFGGTLYRAAPTTVVVRRGTTTRVPAAYSAAPAASGVDITDLTTDGLTVSWTSPPGVDEVVVRLAEGQVAPATTADGAGVAVTGGEATATGLQPATVYSVSVFSRSGDSWLGPLTVQASTRALPGPSGSPTASYALQPGTWAPPPGSDLDIAARDDGRLAVRLPGTPHVGQVVVIPDGPDAPGGFVGAVEAVTATGVGVVGRVGLDRAYKYLELDVPDLATATSPRDGARLGRGLQRAASDLVECAGGGSASITATPDLDRYGHLSVTLATDRSLSGVSLGVEFDVALGLTLQLPVTAQVSGGVSCEQNAIGPFTWPFSAGPVPLALRVEPTLSLEASGTASVTTGLVVSGGFSARGYLPLKSIGFSHARVDEADASGSASVTAPQGELEGSLTAGLGGRVDFGIGSGATIGGDRGALAGIAGELTVAEAAVTSQPTTDPGGCLKTTVEYGGGVGLTAKAWLDDYDAEASLWLLDWYQPYPGTPIYLPASCAPKVWSGTETWILHEETNLNRTYDASLVRRWLHDGGGTVVEQFGTAVRVLGDPACPTTIGPISGGPERSAIPDEYRLRFDDWDGRLETPRWHRGGAFVFDFGYSPPSGIRYSGPCSENDDVTGIDFCGQVLLPGRASVCGGISGDELPPPDGDTFVFEKTVRCTPDLCPPTSWGEILDGYLTFKVRLTAEQDSDGDGIPDSTDPDPSTPDAW